MVYTAEYFINWNSTGYST